MPVQTTRPRQARISRQARGELAVEARGHGLQGLGLDRE